MDMGIESALLLTKRQSPPIPAGGGGVGVLISLPPLNTLKVCITPAESVPCCVRSHTQYVIVLATTSIKAVVSFEDR